jgi:NADH-quinone oxidoreductase subunit N
MTFWEIVQAIAPELILAFGATELLLQAAWGKDKARTYRTVSWISIGLLVLASLSLLGPAHHAGPVFDGQYRADQFAAFAKVLIFLASIVAILMTPRFFGRAGELQAEYPVLILFSAIGMGIMVSAGDLLMLYIGLELQSLSAYVLASFLRRDVRSAEAGLKYFVLGALASGILLYGISLLYGFTGTTLFDGIAASLGDGVSTGELFGIVFVLAGIAFKVSAVPFHMWTPDVYEGAPTPVTAFFASAPKVAAMALLVRVAMEGMGPAAASWQQIVIFMALASTVLGGVAAIGQPNIKRLLAYSSINNVGFALIGLAAATQEGVASVMFYMAVYVAMTLGAFLVVLRMVDAEGRPVETIASLSGLSRTRPGLAAAMAVFMFSLAGIPPLFGFWPKFLVFNAAVEANLTWLAAIGIATSVIGAYYYIKIVKIMYFDDPAPAFEPSGDRVGGGLILASALFVSPLGYLAIPLLDAAAQNAARALL